MLVSSISSGVGQIVVVDVSLVVFPDEAEFLDNTVFLWVPLVVVNWNKCSLLHDEEAGGKVHRPDERRQLTYRVDDLKELAKVRKYELLITRRLHLIYNPTFARWISVHWHEHNICH